VRRFRSWRRRSVLLLAVAALVALVTVDAWVIEPHFLLFRDSVRIPLAAAPLRIVHLSDLHIVHDEPLLHRLLRDIAAARPDVVLLSGDLVHDVPDLGPFARHTAAATAFIAQLHAITPTIYAVQGHSEYQGLVVASLAEAGVHWLSNQGVRLGRERPILLLGLNQQVGEDDFVGHWHSPFRLVKLRRFHGVWHLSGGRNMLYKDFYLHYDPRPTGPDAPDDPADPAAIADEGGPLAWSNYDMLCDAWIENQDVGAGIAVHSRYVLGEDRMLRLRRVKGEHGHPGSFWLIAQGTTFTGHPDTGVVPVPKRWYRLRMRTAVEPGVVRFYARVWPVGTPEPTRWQAWGEDRSPLRIEAGTVGLGAWGGGELLYRNVKVTAADGRVLVDEPFASPDWPEGWHQGARGSRLALALARSPEVPPGTPRIVLSHVPDVVPEAAYRGMEVVLAGHTHGGQVRLPFLGALTTRSWLGTYYAHGVFAFAAPNRQGFLTLFVNQGIGMSVLPIRFWCPPTWAVLDVGEEAEPPGASRKTSLDSAGGEGRAAETLR
jgi:predicted MPP superfamily phosphohydrolase